MNEHFSMLLKYLGVSFITGAISHGFFSGTRSLIFACLGCLFFIIGTVLESKNKKQSITFVFLLITLIMSISLGMFTGGLQHFMDSPERSVWIMPIGFVISLLAFVVIKKEAIDKIFIKYAVISTIISLILSVFLYSITNHYKTAIPDHHSILEQTSPPVPVSNKIVPEITLKASPIETSSDENHHNH